MDTNVEFDYAIVMQIKVGQYLMIAEAGTLLHITKIMHNFYPDWRQPGTSPL